MTEFQPKKRVIDLSGQLQRFSQAYYCGTSQIEDEEYDQLKEELKQLIQAKYATSVFIFILIYNYLGKILMDSVDANC